MSTSKDSIELPALSKIPWDSDMAKFVVWREQVYSVVLAHGGNYAKLVEWHFKKIGRTIVAGQMQRA